jgi:hypothetical protein
MMTIFSTASPILIGQRCLRVKENLRLGLKYSQQIMNKKMPNEAPSRMMSSKIFPLYRVEPGFQDCNQKNKVTVATTLAESFGLYQTVSSGDLM